MQTPKGRTPQRRGILQEGATGYTTLDKAGNEQAVFRLFGKPHGGVELPLVKEPAAGKEPGSPANRARPAGLEEIPWHKP